MPRYQSQESQQQKRDEREFRHAHQHAYGHERGQSSVTGARVGHAGKQQAREQCLIIRKAPHSIKIVKQRNQRYFSTLREKLMWGADQRER